MDDELNVSCAGTPVFRYDPAEARRVREAVFDALRAAERDPDGIDPHAAGAKLDAGKPRVALVLGRFARALREVAKVGTVGAEKYSSDGWLQVRDGVDRYADALGRHLLDEWSGEVFDPATGLDHLAHCAWNALAVLELRLRDRESPG